MPFYIEGAEGLRAVGVELRAAGPGMRSRLRRNIVVAVEPIDHEAKSNWQSSYGGLGDALANATRLRLATAGNRVGVTIGVYGSQMPEGKEGLPPLVEGERDWRHPLFGLDHWYSQAPHQELGPAVRRHLPEVAVAVDEAVAETADALAYRAI